VCLAAVFYTASFDFCEIKMHIYEASLCMVVCLCTWVRACVFIYIYIYVRHDVIVHQNLFSSVLMRKCWNSQDCVCVLGTGGCVSVYVYFFSVVPHV
jgi:hypothetical protein